VAAAGVLLRAARLPALVVALGQLVVLLLWLQHRYGAGEALGGVVPTPASVRAIATAVGAGSEAAQQFAAPVPVTVPQFYPLLIVAGIGTALLVDLLAVGFRRAPLAGLPLLAAYTAPVSILAGRISWLTFAAAALCFLFLIAAVEGERLNRWGPSLGGRGDGTSGSVWSAARRIGITATALAVVVPLLVPTFSGMSLGGGGVGGSDGNGGSVSISNPMVDLRRDLSRGEDVDLLRVTTRDPDPSYLRVSVLDSFDGKAWRPSGRDIPTAQRADGDLPRPPGLTTAVRTTQFDSEIEVSNLFDSRWLPAPYPVRSVRVPGDWRYDTATLDFISAADGQTAAGLRYRVRSLQPQPTAEQLADAGPAPVSVSQPETDLPGDLPASVRRLAQSVTGDAATAFEKAVALQQFFRTDGGFTYSLARSPGNGSDDLVRFLGTGPGSRVGYCEQFAAAMAVLGRAVGIPSRVAVGFLRPDKVGAGAWVYSSHDLHSWPEMYFSGVGWVRFEPTPQDRTGSVPGYTTAQVPQAAPTDSASSSAPATVPSSGPAAQRPDQQTTPDAAAGSGSSGGHGWLVTLGVLLLVVLLGLAPWALRTRVRRRRWTQARTPGSHVEAGWAEVRDTARDLGIDWDDRVTLRTSAARLDGHLDDPAAREAVHRLVGLLERARYARDLPEEAASGSQVRADAELCVRSLLAGAGRGQRLRARWLPVSVLGFPAPSRAPRRAGGDAVVDRAV
jgi:transglutaminase-like putative cysteine protease